MTAAFDAPRRTDQRFADALSGPDGTTDPSVLMPVLQVYPDALSAPMPDAMVPVPALDPAALARATLAGRQTMPSALPPPVQPARASGRGVAQPGRSGRSPAASRPQAAIRTTAGAPSAMGHPAAPPPGAARPWSARVPSATEFADWAKAGFSGPMPHGTFWDSIGRAQAIPRSNPTPAAHAPTPPLPRRLPRTARRNKGSGVWAVLVFLIVIAFASGLGQQLIQAISELFNR